MHGIMKYDLVVFDLDGTLAVSSAKSCAARSPASTAARPSSARRGASAERYASWTCVRTVRFTSATSSPTQKRPRPPA